jgi:hypothetical protein
MEFRTETLLKGTCIYKSCVCVFVITLEGLTDTAFCDYVVKLGDELPFRLFHNGDWNWCEENGVTERADFVGLLIEEYGI